MDKNRLETEFDHDAQLRAPLGQLGPNAAPPQGHDDFILQAARETGESIRKRASRQPSWRMPLSLAASFVLGLAIARIYTAWTIVEPTTVGESQFSGLVIPATPEVRGAQDSRMIPVEQVPADVWYRYIQELVYSGDAQLAARHLQRFVELHPDYVHQP